MDHTNPSDSQKVLPGVSFLFFDMLLFNLLFYHLLKSLLFMPLGHSRFSTVLLWIACFSLFVFASGRAQLHGKRVRPVFILIQWTLFVGVALALARLAQVFPIQDDTDWSWLVPEFIKVPLWFQMFLQASRLFSGCVMILVIALMGLVATSPKSRWLRILPALALLAVSWQILAAFSETETYYPYLYFVCFAGPVWVFAALLYFRIFRLAFRVAPIMLHFLLVGLNYTGFLPVNSPLDLVPFADSGAAYVEAIPGASRIYTPTAEEKTRSFIFPRKIFTTDRQVIFSYGPMGASGILTIDLTTRSVKKVRFEGLVRDLQPAPDNEHIWGTNWQMATFLSFPKNALDQRTSVKLAPFQINTPWSFACINDKVYISNVTFPILAAFAVEQDRAELTLIPTNSINYFQEGYTAFTDGAFGIFVDPARNRIYNLVGMVGGKYQIALVELDLTTFKILREIRLPAGTTIVPVQGKDTVLLPSYFYRKIYEVSLADMSLVRAIDSEPTIFRLEHDPKRNLLYATSRTTGRLVVIDYPTGQTKKRVAVGANPEALFFDREDDSLYIGSQAGILRIFLPTFLNEDPL